MLVLKSLSSCTTTTIHNIAVYILIGKGSSNRLWSTWVQFGCLFNFFFFLTGQSNIDDCSYIEHKYMFLYTGTTRPLVFRLLAYVSVGSMFVP